MDTRKLIKFGKNSYVISVPKDWIKENNLDKGSLIFLEKNNNNQIVLNAIQQKINKTKKIVIETDKKNMNAIKRQIIAAYLNHYNIIEIKNKNMRKIAKDIREVFNGLVAIEIMEEDKDKIVAKDFLRLDDLSIKNLIKRIDILIRSMILDIENIKNNSELKSFIRRDSDINKLYFLAYRAITELVINPELMKKMNLTTSQIMSYWKIIMDLEKISDEFKTISVFIFKMKPDEKKDVLEMIKELETQYKIAIKALKTKDLDIAFKATELKSTIISKCEKKMNKCSRSAIRPLQIILHTSKIIHHIPRTVINTEDLFLL